MTDEQTMAVLINEGYSMVCKVPGRGFCGLRRMLFTWGLFYGLRGDSLDTAYQGRYCYQYHHDAVTDLVYWTGKGDPPGDWIKHFGVSGEYPNPNNLDQRTSTAS